MRSLSGRLGLGFVAVVISALSAGGVHAQPVPPPPPVPPAAPLPPDPPPIPSIDNNPRVYRTTGSRVAIGRSITVAADEEVTDAVVAIGGSVRVDGRVRDGVVAIGGNVELGPQADVRGDVVVVGGRLSRAPGARLSGSVSDVSIGTWAPWGWRGTWRSDNDFNGFAGWFAVLGTSVRIALLALCMGLLLLVARAPVARISRAAALEPGRAFLVGLAVEILFVPALIIASIALVVTLIGIPLVAVLVPAALFALGLALLLGFTGMACGIGEWLEDRLGWHAHSALLATALGLFLIVGPTVVSRIIELGPGPLRLAASALLVSGVVLEFVVWTTGLGAAIITGMGRWSTAPPPIPPAAQPFVTVPNA